MISDRKKDPRAGIKALLAKGDLAALLEKAGEIHGHYCSHMAFGVIATHEAFRRLGIIESTGMEEILAIVECNNCFVDGIQAVSGCTFGNNALIYKDFGKTAVTFVDRKRGRAVRLASTYTGEVDPTDPEAVEAHGLFERAVKRRERLSDREMARMQELWTKAAFAALKRPAAELFKIEDVPPEKISYAPIFESITCAICGEPVMETRMTFQKARPVCIVCADSDYWMVAGRGIHPVGKA